MAEEIACFTRIYLSTSSEGYFQRFLNMNDILYTTYCAFLRSLFVRRFTSNARSKAWCVTNCSADLFALNDNIYTLLFKSTFEILYLVFWWFNSRRRQIFPVCNRFVICYFVLELKSKYFIVCVYDLFTYLVNKQIFNVYHLLFCLFWYELSQI